MFPNITQSFNPNWKCTHAPPSVQNGLSPPYMDLYANIGHLTLCNYWMIITNLPKCDARNNIICASACLFKYNQPLLLLHIKPNITGKNNKHSHCVVLFVFNLLKIQIDWTLSFASAQILQCTGDKSSKYIQESKKPVRVPLSAVYTNSKDYVTQRHPTCIVTNHVTS